jgi:hypothetical protein
MKFSLRFTSFLRSLGPMSATARMLTLVVSMLSMTASEGFAQVPTFDLHDYQFRCRFAQEARESLKDLDSETVLKNIDDSITDTLQALKQDDLEKSEIKVLKTHLRLLKELKADQSPRSKLDSFYQNLCLGSESSIKGVSKLIFHATSAYQQTVTLPARSIFRFFKGLITGKNNDFTQIRWNQALGEKNSLGISSFLLYQGYQALSAGSMVLAPLYISAMTDTLAAKICDLPEALSTSDQKFCERYQGLKTKFYQIANQGQSLGAKLSPKQNKSAEGLTSPSWNVPVTDENYCEWLSSERAQLDSNEVTAAVREVLLGTMNPGALAHPKISKLKTESSQIIATDSTSISKLRNVIISLSPPEEIVQQLKTTGSLERFQHLQSEVQELLRQDEQLFRMNTVESCQKKKDQIGFRYQTLIEKQKELGRYRSEAFYLQHQLIESQFKKSKTRLKWELVSSISLNSLRELLRAPDVANVIIVTHSLENNRKMIDSNFNQIPTTFFGEFSPSLLSLSFFTCNSEDYLKTYDLASRWSKSASIHPERWMSLVDQAGILGNSNRAPMNGFLDFLKRIDRLAERSLQNSMLSQSLISSESKREPPIEQRICTLDLPQARVIQGALALILNRQFIGTISATENNTRLEFDCSLLKEVNTLKIQGVSMIDPLRVESIPTEVRLNDQIVKEPQREDFYDSENRYSMSLFELKRNQE